MPHLSSSKVSVIVPTWNQASLVRSVLVNLSRQTRLPDETIVVDNGSADDTVDVAQSLGAKVVRFDANQGFAAAVNAGIAAASGEWLFILNNDVDLAPDWLEVALNAGRAANADFVTGKLLQARNPERLDGTWDLVSKAGCAWRCGFNALDGLEWNNARPIHLFSFTAVLIHRRIFEAIGFLDTRYESYYEDVDFGLRSALAGFRGIYQPTAIGRHWGSATLGRGPRTAYLVSRNQVLLAAKFYLSKDYPWRTILGQALFLVSCVRQGTVLAGIRGKWDGWRLARAFRREPVDTDRLQTLLNENEAEIQEFQRRMGFDLTWRIYFAVTRPSKP